MVNAKPSFRAQLRASRQKRRNRRHGFRSELVRPLQTPYMIPHTDSRSRHGFVVIGGKGAQGQALSDVWVTITRYTPFSTIHILLGIRFYQPILVPSLCLVHQTLASVGCLWWHRP
jgi:hypothetical protein